MVIRRMKDRCEKNISPSQSAKDEVVALLSLCGHIDG